MQIEKIDPKKIYTIGDGYSDISMIKKYNGYCMKESVPALLDICNGKIVDSVSDLFDIYSR